MSVDNLFLKVNKIVENVEKCHLRRTRGQGFRQARVERKFTTKGPRRLDYLYILVFPM